MGCAPLLLAALDRTAARGLTDWALVESPTERGLQSRESLERGAVVGSRRARTSRFAPRENFGRVWKDLLRDLICFNARTGL